MFKTIEYYRFLNGLKGFIMLVICASHLIEPLNGIDIDMPTDYTRIILELHNTVYFFVAMISFMAIPFNKSELKYMNLLQTIHFCIMITSNLYLYRYNIMSTWTTPIMNFTLLFMYLIPSLPLPEKRDHANSLVMECEKGDNIF